MSQWLPVAVGVLLFICTAVHAAPEVPCSDATDCSLNGVCRDGACVCDEGWTTLPFGEGGKLAPGCGYLDFLPAPVNGCGPACVYHAAEGNTASWGSSVLLTDGGTYAMFAAEMVRNCSLNSWKTNSEVVLATSSSLTAEFQYKQQVVAPWAHNPQAIRTRGGTYVLYTLGDGVPSGALKDCLSTRVHSAATAPTHPRAPGRAGNEITVHAAPAPTGPWTARVIAIQRWNASWSLSNYNPAPMVLPDGRVRLMIHTLIDQWAGMAVVEAPTWDGVYRVVDGQAAGDDDHCTFCEEDPFMWRDARGHYHVLVHRMFDPYGPLDPAWGRVDEGWAHAGSPIPKGWAGGHAWSRDGLAWSPVTRCYNTTVALAGGGSVALQRRERPKLVFAEDGTPTHLFNGALGAERGAQSYTMVAPLNVRQNR